MTEFELSFEQCNNSSQLIRIVETTIKNNKEVNGKPFQVKLTSLAAQSQISADEVRNILGQLVVAADTGSPEVKSNYEVAANFTRGILTLMGGMGSEEKSLAEQTIKRSLPGIK